jgi:hypothetical protein
LIKKPGRANDAGSGCLDAVLECSIRGDDGDITVIVIDLRSDGLDNRVIPRPLGVDGPQPTLPPGRDAPSRSALKDQDDLVVWQRGTR